jgi:hypothetical protein
LAISVEKREKIAGIPAGMPILLPVFPLEDGSFLVRYLKLSAVAPGSQPVAPSPQDLNPILVRVKSAQEVLPFDSFYPGLVQVTLNGTVAASKNQVVVLLNAITDDEKLNRPQTEPHPFLAFFDLDGRMKKIRPLNVSAAVSAMGIFGNGEILIATSTTAGGNSLRKHLCLYDADARFEKEFYQDNPYILKKGDPSAALDTVSEVFSYGDNLLAFRRTNSSVTLSELVPSGVAREWTIKLPKEMEPLQLIPSSGPHWLISYTRSGQEDRGSRRVEGVFEFDKETGELTTKFTSTSPAIFTEIVRWQNNEISGLMNDPGDYSYQLAQARVGGQ